MLLAICLKIIGGIFIALGLLGWYVITTIKPLKNQVLPIQWWEILIVVVWLFGLPLIGLAMISA